MLNLAKKQMLQFCYTVDNFSRTEHDEILFSDKCKDDFHNRVKKQEVEYTVGSFIVLNVEETEVEFSKILKIEKVYDTDDPEIDSKKRKITEKVFLHIECYQEVYFNIHLHTFVVKRVQNLDKIISISDIPITSPVVAIYDKKKRSYTEKKDS